jgi:hypothetical protein
MHPPESSVPALDTETSAGANPAVRARPLRAPAATPGARASRRLPGSWPPPAPPCGQRRRAGSPWPGSWPRPGPLAWPRGRCGQARRRDVSRCPGAAAVASTAWPAGEGRSSCGSARCPAPGPRRRRSVPRGSPLCPRAEPVPPAPVAAGAGPGSAAARPARPAPVPAAAPTPAAPRHSPRAPAHQLTHDPTTRPNPSPTNTAASTFASL